MADDNSEFNALSARLRLTIDGAFDAAVQPARPDKPSPAKRRRVEEPASAPGGFLPDAQPGGFIVDDEPAGGSFVCDDSPAETGGGGFVTDNSPQASHIPLRLIPNALQLLDLQPDDEDVLAVFQNAAAGWGAGGTDGEASVSRKDWRAVCAVLLGQRDEDPGDVAMSEAGDAAAAEDASAQSEEDFVDDGEVDEYVDEDDEDEEPVSDDASDEEYGVATRSKKPQKTGKREDAASVPVGPTGLTARQKREARQAFALFFPDVNDADLGAQRLMIKDIIRVAKLLKERLTADDMVEMLQEFSSSADRSVSLSDFEQIMVAAKLA